MPSKKSFYFKGVLMAMCLSVAFYNGPVHAQNNEGDNQSPPPQVTQARAITKQFQRALSTELKQAIKSGGLDAGVTICHDRAPTIAAEIGEKTGWSVARTSLKSRNENNIPTDAQRTVLNDFETKRGEGEPIARLEWWDMNDDGMFSYMKAIPTKGLCLQCHGTSISPDLSNHIQNIYPHDMATGFKPGDIRGAFVLEKYVDSLKPQTKSQSFE